MRAKRVLTFGAGGLGVAGAGLVAFVATYSPAQRAAADVQLPDDAETLARGKYLADHVMACGACHGERNWSVFGAPTSNDMGGGECWGETQKFPGQVCAPNLTNSDNGLGQWSDGEVLRAMREGVDRDGNALGIMPYEAYVHASDEDSQSVLAYLRSLEPVDKSFPDPSFDFPVSFFLKLGPKPIEQAVQAPARGETAEYGEYLSRVALCYQCHTPVDDNHQLLEDRPFFGGQVFEGEFGTVVSANITPSSAGIGGLTREAFIQRFRDHRNSEQPAPGGRNTVMPWQNYADMTDQDLGAIYTFLQTVPKSDEGVVTFPPAG